MPTTYTKPDQNLSFNIPDEGEVFGVAGNDQNFYRRRGNTIEAVNYVNALLGADAGQFGNAGEQRQEAIRRAQAQGLNLEAQTYNWGDITSTGLFQLGGNSGPTTSYSGDLASFFNTRSPLSGQQTTLTQGLNSVNQYARGDITDQFGNVVQRGTTNTPQMNQAAAIQANQVPLGYYTQNINGRQEYMTSPATNTPYGQTAISREEYITGLNRQLAEEQQKLIEKPYAHSTIVPAIEQLRQRIAEAQQNTSGMSNLYSDGKGGATTAQSLQQQQQLQAAVEAGTMREISPGMFVPVGSSADQLAQGQITAPQQTQQISMIQPGSSTPVPVTGTLPRQALVQGALNPKGQEANTLYDFYSAQGTPLPSLEERGGLYERLGLGGGGEYRGTAAQNTALLNALKQQASFGNTVTGDVDVAKTIAADLLGDKTGLVIPPMGTLMSLNDYGNALLQQIFNPQQTQEGKDNDLLTNRIAELTRASGNEQADLLAEQEKAGVQRLEAEKRDLETALRNEAQIFFQRQQAILNQQGVSRGAMVGQEREADADRILNMGRLSVTLDAINGSYMAALNKAQGIVDAKYSQIENEIEYTKLLLEANQDKMSRKEKQQAQQLELFLQFRKEAIDEQKAEENAIYELAIEAQKNGASAATTQKIMSSTSRQQALGLAGMYIGKLDREQQAFENSMKRSQLALQQDELGLKRTALSEEKALAQQQQARQAEEATASLDARIAEISRLSNHPGLDSRVGPNALARGFFSIQDRAGAGQDFAGSIQQLVSKDTLDTLLNLKRAGGTLGALSDKEAALLTNAATKLGAWEKKKDGIGTGEWNIDQASFKRELKTIQDLAITARNRALGDLVSEEDANDI